MKKKVKVQNCICVYIFVRVREIANSISEKSYHSLSTMLGLDKVLIQGKLNCSCKYSVYILKPVLSGLCL